jgi:O-antigen ligase
MNLAGNSTLKIVIINIALIALLIFLANQAAFFTVTHSTQAVLGLLFIAFAILICLKRRTLIVSVFAIAMLLPVFVNEVTVGRFINLGNIAFAAILILIFIPFFIRREKIYISPIDKWVMALMLITFIGMLRTQLKYGFSVNEWLQSFFKPIQLISIYFIIVNVFKEKKDVKIFLTLLLITASILGILMIRDHFGLLAIRSLYYNARTGGIAGGSTAMALFFLLMVPIALSRFHTSKDIIKKMCFGSIFLLLLISIVYSYARAEYIGFCIVIGTFYAFERKKIKILPVMIVSLLVILAFPSHIFDRLKTIYTIEENSIRIGSAGKLRSDLFDAGLKMIYNNPSYNLVGGGDAVFENEGYKYSKKPIMSVGRDPHNLLMGIYIEYGIVGIIVYVMLILKLVNISRGLLKSKNEDAVRAGQTCLAMLSGFVFCSVLQSYELFGSGSYQIIIWSFIGVILFYYSKEREENLKGRRVS